MKRPDAPPNPPTPIVRRGEAAHESECETCGFEIEPGDEAGFIGDDTRASCGDCCCEAEDG